MDKTNLSKSLNILDTQITQIMNAAEKKCSKVPRTAHDAWSPTLHNAIQNIWECRYQIRELHRRTLTEPHINALSFQIATEALNQAKETYTELKKTAVDERKKHLDTRAKFYAKSTSSTHIKQAIKQIQQTEKQRATAFRINIALHRNKKAGINGILVPDITEYPPHQQSQEGFDHLDIQTMWNRITPKNGQDVQRWERITNKKIVDKLLLGWQCQHFLQANETPFATDEWRTFY